MFIATMDSEHFTWQAIGATADAARAAIANGWEREMTRQGLRIDPDLEPSDAGGDVTMTGVKALDWYGCNATDALSAGDCACDYRKI